MQNLKNQKERDMEDLAYKIAQQLQNNSNEIYKNYIDSSEVSYVRIYKEEIDYNTFLDYCLMPHSVLSEDKESVYFYTISQNNVNPLKQLKAGE